MSHGDTETQRESSLFSNSNFLILSLTKDEVTRRFFGEKPPVPLGVVAATGRMILRQAQDEVEWIGGLVPTAGLTVGPLCLCVSVVNISALTAAEFGECSL